MVNELRTLKKLVVAYAIGYIVIWLLLIGFGVWVIIKLLNYFGVI